MLLGAFITLIIFIIVYLLLAPIRLVVNTDRNQYYVEQKGLVKAQIAPDEKDILKIKMKVLFFKFNIYPLRKNKTSKIRKKQVKTKSTKRYLNFKKVIRVIKSFKIKRFHLYIDTGDCISNAKLYPVFALLNYFNVDCKVNFTGRNSLILAIENRPIRIIKSFINF